MGNLMNQNAEGWPNARAGTAASWRAVASEARHRFSRTKLAVRTCRQGSSQSAVAAALCRRTPQNLQKVSDRPPGLKTRSRDRSPDSQPRNEGRDPLGIHAQIPASTIRLRNFAISTPCYMAKSFTTLNPRFVNSKRSPLTTTSFKSFSSWTAALQRARV